MKHPPKFAKAFPSPCPAKADVAMVDLRNNPALSRSCILFAPPASPPPAPGHFSPAQRDSSQSDEKNKLLPKCQRSSSSRFPLPIFRQIIVDQPGRFPRRHSTSERR